MSCIDPYKILEKENQRLGASTFADEQDLIESKLAAFLEIYHLPSNRFVRFKAILDSFTQTWEQKWAAEETYGRNDDIATYKGTKRNIDLSFKVPARSPADGARLEADVSRLATFQYAGYDNSGLEATGISQPPLVKVKFGNKIIDTSFGMPGGGVGGGHKLSAGEAIGGNAKFAGLLCRMNGFVDEWNEEGGFYFPSPGVFLPKLRTISFSLIAMHQHSLGWEAEGDGGENSAPRPREGSDCYPYKFRTAGQRRNFGGNYAGTSGEGGGAPPQDSSANSSGDDENTPDELKQARQEAMESYENVQSATGRLRRGQLP